MEGFSLRNRMKVKCRIWLNLNNWYGFFRSSLNHQPEIQAPHFAHVTWHMRNACDIVWVSLWRGSCTMLHHVAPCCTSKFGVGSDASTSARSRMQREKETEKRKEISRFERDFSLWKCSKAKRWLAMIRNCKMCVDRSRYPKYDCMFQRPSGFPWISLYTGMPVVGKCQHRLKLDSLRGSCRFCHVQISVLLGWFVPGWNAPLIPLNKRCSIALKYSLRLVIDCWKMWKQIASNCHLRVWRFVDLNFGNGKVWSEEHLETM